MLAQLRELVFPESCVSCGAAGAVLCARCQSAIIPIRSQLCAGCGRLSEFGFTCQNCRKKIPLRQVVVAAHFGAELRAALHAYKYRRRAALAPLFVELMTVAAEANHLSAPLAPVPSFWLKQILKGGNHVERITQTLASALDVDYRSRLLRKTRFTHAQVGLSGQARRENLSARDFRVRVAPPSEVILIDDLLTTGTTLIACAAALQKAGARRVSALVLAKSGKPILR